MTTRHHGGPGNGRLPVEGAVHEPDRALRGDFDYLHARTDFYGEAPPWPFISHGQARRNWRRGEIMFSGALMGGAVLVLVVSVVLGRIGWPW